jgi:hydroxycarboxylate dehydrogenase B
MQPRRISLAPAGIIARNRPTTAPDAIMLIPHETLRANAVRIFQAAGSSAEEAEIVADHLVEANLRGHDSHGVGMISIYMKNIANGTLVANRRGRIIKEEGAILHYDGERGYGQVTARLLTELGIERARRTGLAAVALRNAHHIGRIGSYGEQCAAAGLVSLHFVNVIGHEPNVAPHRGADARLGTNPVCIALPAAEEGRPMILDMATSKVAVGKVRVAYNEGRALAEGLLLDGAGRPTTDPGALFAEPGGAVLPMGDHKGYALAFACELLAGALTGGGTLTAENQGHDTITNNMLAFILDPGRLVDPSWLRREIQTITGCVTASPPRDPEAPVLIPGDPERRMRAWRMAEGIPIDEVTWGQLVAAAAGHGVKL